MNKQRHTIIYFVLTSIMCLSLTYSKLSAQENILFTNYNNNKVFINPAFSGSTPYMEVAMGYHKQWTGVDGAPKSAILSAHTPLNNRPIGIGTMIYSNEIGILNETGFFANYAYKIKMSKRRVLSLGLQAGVVSKEVRWSEVVTYDPNFTGDDPSIPNMDISNISPNFGLGAYYTTPKFHLGFSAPRLLQNAYPNEKDFSKSINFEFKEIYFYINSGVILNINSTIQATPSILLFSSLNSTTNYNFNINFTHTKGVSVGTSFRSGKYWSINTGYEFNSKLGISYAYENSFDKLKRGDHTSHEIFLNYKVSLKKSSYTSPRFF
ncbi:type IX secretion system membrane protein PorP/SprF [Ancylomarina sp. 16SWW S1-10-2]|uniref:PorP/SprF family type IX secretion system membrane protein n=1 Tax=Ancylomarina sp. 16SWW S1-10-2 TaxID=2499681 RepID=UPI0012AE6CFF|nr:type IX secretion system membrane protein PorP/SprF [Ancylomarina sp. 16SWW S1-10-2]MRT91890.1 type IX secretion system membrane protein PorP/SprF [Ancylomarina sp. 16SWW S1-10-2]